MKRKIIDEDEEFQRYYRLAQNDSPRVIAQTARAVDRLVESNEAMGNKIDKHCKANIIDAHPSSKKCADGVHCGEDVSTGWTIRGKFTSEGVQSFLKWFAIAILVILTGGDLASKLLGGF